MGSQWEAEINHLVCREPLRLPKITRDPLLATRNVLRQSSSRGAFAARAPAVALPTTLMNISNARYTREELWEMVPAPLTKTYLLTLQRSEDFNRRQTLKEMGIFYERSAQIWTSLMRLTEGFCEAVRIRSSEEEAGRNDLIAVERLMFKKLKKSIKRGLVAIRESEIFSPTCPHLTQDTALYLDYGTTDALTVSLVWEGCEDVELTLAAYDGRHLPMAATYLKFLHQTGREDNRRVFRLELSAAEVNMVCSMEFWVTGEALAKMRYGWLIFSDIYNGPPRQAKEIPITLANRVQIVTLQKKGTSWSIRGTQDLIFDNTQRMGKDRFYTSSWEDLESIYRSSILKAEELSRKESFGGSPM